MKKLGLLVGVLLLSGCLNVKVEPVKLGSGTLSSIKGQPVEVVVYEAAPLQVFTPGAVVGGGLIDYMTRPDGSRIALPSPSYLISTSMRSKLTALNLQEVPNATVPLTEKDEQKPAATGSYSLGVLVKFNMFSYLPVNWQTYRYTLRGSASLRDPQGNILWQDNCEVYDHKDLQLNRLEFKTDDAKRPREIMEIAAGRCADQLVNKFNGSSS